MAPPNKRLFVSYSREDKAKVEPLVAALRQLPYDVWLDTRLSGGTEWWDRILTELRAAEAVVVAVSPDSIQSEACQSELSYARAINRPILPVMIDTVRQDTLPGGLGVLQVVDYRPSQQQQGILDLVNALMQLPEAPPLPEQLPTTPKVPGSYDEIVTLLERPQLSREEQLMVVGELRARVDRPRDRDAVLDLAHRMQNRVDLYQVAAKELDALIDVGTKAPVVAPQPQFAQQPLQQPSPQPPAPPQQVFLQQGAAPPLPPRPVPNVPAPTTSSMGGLEIATILLLIFCAPIGLITVWLTRWSTGVKVTLFLIAGSVWGLALIAAMASSSSSTG